MCSPGSMLHQGAWFCIRWVLVYSSDLHARIHFDQGVLGHLGTDRLLREPRRTIGVVLHDKDRQHWLGTCSVCMPTSQGVWGASLIATY
jgi:hypothetical protein